MEEPQEIEESDDDVAAPDSGKKPTSPRRRRDVEAVVASERHRGGLMIVATLPRRRMPLADVRAILAHAAEAEWTPLAALADAEKLGGISPAGKDTLAQLRFPISTASTL